MTTSVANLDPTQYVKVNTNRNSITLQSMRDEIRIALSDVEPAISNTVFHTLNGGDNPLQFLNIETDVWVLSMTNRSKLTITETDAVGKPSDFFTEVGKGNVPGHSFVAIVGHNPSCSTTNFDDIWAGGGNMVLPTTGEELEIVSDSPLDTAGGDGARTVLISTLDTDLNPISTAPVTLNGTSAVTIPGGAVHFRMNHLTATSGGFVLTAGDMTVNPTESNIGKLTIREVGTGLVRSVIMPMIGKCEDAHVIPPAGFSIFGLRNLLTWPEGQSGTIVLTIKSRVANSARISTGRVPIYQQPVNIIFEAKNRGTSFLDRALRAKSLNSGIAITTITEYLMVDDNFL